MAESYLPLLAMLSRLEDDGVGYKLLISLSPTLASMMEDSLLQERFARYLGRIIRLADREEARSAEGVRRRLARFHGDFYRDALFWFEEKCRRRVAKAFADLARLGNLEIITCGATHGFLPLLRQNPASVRAQFLAARACHKSIFGADADGVWLPECAYYSGVERFMAEAGFSYSFLDAHGLENADIQPERGLYAPIATGEGVSFFGRDRETSRQVWSAEQGYPGDPCYREFYRDLGFELPEADLGEFLVDGRIRVNTGLKFNRITSRQGGDKEPYDPGLARERAAQHAGHFLENRQRQVERLLPDLKGRPPLIVAPYDAELFGHWWFEGPRFLDYALRKMHYDQDTVKCLSPSGYLRMFPDNQRANPAGSSWGGDGTSEFWVNADNQDIIPGLHQAADRMSETARLHSVPVPAESEAAFAWKAEAARQMLRELMLAQASDWPFIMRTGTSPGYARSRVEEHLKRFWAISQMLDRGRADEAVLDAIRRTDNIFPECDLAWHV
jgi:1,4-alpha-glucan branching enzyme